ncbi:MAG: septum formation initiator family protein [Chloroflexi bacterium]|nr:septum formation initiator family protein [Chloroflexota bacterium]MCY3686017.1 septum formation initiator family protein [Chloroflexota bacterium]MXX81440.1 septum formation initiator family protein [Chloroflexota bacterium]MYB21363.1 septum formation initiator family protein [Chloroflexota bacterium]MYF23017.1 septum formation initiator family protein [Chloroflexota bacterium]
MNKQDGIPAETPVEHVLTTDNVYPLQAARPGPFRWAIRRAAFVASLLLVGFVVYSGVAGLVQANSLDDRILETRAEIVHLRQDADQLAALIAWLDSDAYIERIAREDLGMVRPGEEAFAVHAPGRGQLEVNRSPWWANLLPPGAE